MSRATSTSEGKPRSQESRLLREAVWAAGEIAMQYFGERLTVWRKSADEPVSEADIAVNRYLHDTITSRYPEDGWLSEEDAGGRADPPAGGRLWIVDPIDGTRSYLRGRQDFAVSVALAEAGSPVLAAVLEPASGDLYFAERGGGARLNGAPIRVSTAREVENCRMGADEAFFRARRHWPVAWPEMTYEAIGSIALRLARVGAGRLDASASLREKSHWDLAAGHLIVEEAGGACVDETGTPLVYDRFPPVQPCFAAAPPGLLEGVLERLRPAMARYRGRREGGATRN